MATGHVVLPIPGGIAPDGSGSGNNPARPSTLISGGTQTTNSSKVTLVGLLFLGATNDEHWAWQFNMPSNYASDGTLRLTWQLIGTSTNTVVWKAAAFCPIAGTTDTDGAAGIYDTVVTASGTPSATQGIQTQTTLTLTMTNAAASRYINIMVGRDQDNGSDTNTSDAFLVAATFEYTTT